MRGRDIAILCGVLLVAQFLSSALWEFWFEETGLSILGNSEFRLELAEVALETVTAVLICGATLAVMNRLMSPTNLPGSLRSDPNSRALFRHSPDAILVVRAGRIVSANFAAASVLGAKEPAHLVGRSVTEFLRPRFLAPGEKRLTDIRDDDVVPLMEERCKRFDGSAIDLEVWGGPCRWEGHAAIQLFARDITWRKHAQELLEKSEAELHGIFENAGDAIGVHDMNGRLIKVNRQACLAFGYTEDELLALRFDQLTEGAGTEALQEHWRRLEAGETMPALTLTAQRKDGSTFPAETRLGLYRRGGGGTLIVSLIRDIGERVAAERVRDDLLDTIKNVDAGIALFDTDERLAFCNEKFREFYEPIADVLQPGASYESFVRAYYDRGQEREHSGLGRDEWVQRRLERFRQGRQTSSYRRGDLWLQRLRFQTPNGGRMIVMTDITERKRTEIALLESEALFRVAFENAVVGISLRRIDRTVARFNPAFSRIFGYSAEELSAMSLRDIAMPEEYPRGDTRNRLLSGKEDNIQIEQRFIHKDGHIIWVLASHSLVRDAEGKPLYTIAVFSDITEQRRAREALRQSEARYRSIVDTAEEGVWLFDDNLKTVFGNRHLADLLGVDDNSLPGRPFSDFIGPASEELVRLSTTQWRAGTGGRYDICLRRKDGSDIWAIIAVKPFLGEDGQFSGALGMVTDITQRKEAEEALRDQNRLLQTLIDAIPTPIYYKDDKGVYLGCNAEFEKFLGKPASEIIGKTVFDVAPKSFADKNDSSDRSIIKKGGKIVFESAVKWADGTPRDVIFHKSVFTRGEGETAGLVAAMIDITVRKKAEEQLRHMANFDGLTGIPNRNLGRDRLVGALARARRNRLKTAVFFVDLDGFKSINDSFGHEAGDKVLKDVAHRLVGAVRETDTVCRFGGDEFTVIATDIKEWESLKRVAENILESLVEPFAVGDEQRRLGASIGIAVYPEDGADPDSLIRAADTAMYGVKVAGKGTYKFASDPQPKAAE